MSALTGFVDQLRGQFQSGANVVRSRIFGINNERLDFLMDSFYKLEPPQRTLVFSGIVGAVGLFVFGAVMLYFAQVNRLRTDLNESFAALHELRELRGEFQDADKRFDKLIERVQSRTSDFSPKPFFAKIATEQGVQLEGGLQESRVPIAADNPLSEKMQEVRIEMRLNNISVPRLLNFIVEAEKADKFVRVQDLDVQARFGTKLFFYATIKARAYAVNK